MKKLVNLILCVVILISGEVWSKRVKRLTNAIKISASHFPYMISLQYHGEPHCGGALVDKQHAITAAHCLCYAAGKPISDLKNFTIVAGSKDLRDQHSGIRMKLKKISCHPEFDYSADWRFDKNDIAVIRFNEPIETGESIEPIGLPAPFQEFPDGTQFLVTGYGSTTFNGPPSTQLRLIIRKSISQDECQNSLPDFYVGSTHICTKPAYGSGACDYDDGDPMIRDTPQGRVIVGLVSNGDLSSCGTAPDIYTKVSNYVNYIQAEMLFG